MTARWTALVLWAAVAVSAIFWAFKLFVASPPAPAHTTVAAGAPSPRGDLHRLFGADPVALVAEAPPPPTRFQLIGVVAPRGSNAARDGVALIGVDGKPAKAYRVGAAIDGDTVLQSVQPRGATLGPRGGNPSVSLDIPPPQPAATGMLPAASALQVPVPGPVPSSISIPSARAQRNAAMNEPRPLQMLQPAPTPRGQQAGSAEGQPTPARAEILQAQ